MTRSLRLVLAAAALLAIALPSAVSASSPSDHGTSDPRRINLPDGFQPEGITSHGSNIYTGSLANGAIFRANVRTGAGAILAPGATGRVAAGIHFDTRGPQGRLWVAGGPTGEVRIHNARTGAVRRTFTIAGAGFLNDLVILRNAVFVTDSSVQQLDVIHLGDGGRPTGPVTMLPLTGAIHFVANQFNANGIVRFKQWLIIDQTVTGQIFRVNMQTGRTRLINTHGLVLAGADGMTIKGNVLYVVSNSANRVTALRLGERALQARRIRTLTAASLDTPTGATLADGFVWAVNARFDVAPTASTPYWVTRLPQAN